ncbi:hypothetical protein AALP_AA6G246700 [Arabis alpina]|uniref:peptidylprolyl isomerase n=1 Tax=Arabis alpina TaxID=50452 RepID=A0A087GRH0_ARAAL|nr:hypothetical protein AALP_AA6G246700 [Arabis alpina]
MAFWGVEVKPGKPFTLESTQATGITRLHISQATLGLGNGTLSSTLQCNVGGKKPLFLCVLTPNKVDSCQLNLEFEEADEVIFSVIGPRSIHLTGYFLGRSTGFRKNDDESESYGEDVSDTDIEKASSDDYDYEDSFINDGDPCGRGSHVSSTDDNEIYFKELAAKIMDKKSNGKGGRLRKKFQISDSDCDETSARANDDSLDDDSIQPRDKCEKKTSEATSHTNKTLDKKEDESMGNVELFPVQKGCEILSKKKKRNKKSKSLVVMDSEDEEGKHMPESLQNEKPTTEKEIKSSSDLLPSPNATPTKKKRERITTDETRDVRENLFDCPKSKKQATDKNIEKEDGGAKEPLGSEISSNEVIIEDIEKGKLEGKSAAKGSKVSILYTAKLKDTGKLFDSNLGEAPLKFLIGGEKVIKGLSIGVEGMRVGDKRRLVIPPSLGYSEEGLKEDVPKNAWLVYEVEAVKIK